MRVLALAVLTLMPLVAMAEDAAPPAPRPAPQTETRPTPRPDAGATGAEAGDGTAGNANADNAAPEAPEAGPGQAASPPTDPVATPIREQLRESDFDHSACLLELTLLGADYSEQPTVTEAAEPDCGIARPILLRRPLPGIEIDGSALIRCDTARHLAHWLRDFVRPAAAMLPGQPRLIALEPGSTYQCRATIGGQGKNLSEHAFGDAFDIGAFRFDDGTRLAVQPRQDSGDLPEAFQRTVRASACLHFTTVLGPGANAAHDNHLHLDIKARRSGWRLCQ